MTSMYLLIFVLCWINCNCVISTPKLFIYNLFILTFYVENQLICIILKLLNIKKKNLSELV